MVTSERPDVLIAAPDDYWKYWQAKSSGAGWERDCSDLANDLAQQLGTTIEMIGIGVPGLDLGFEGRPPRITSDLRIETIGRWSGRRSIG
jgi:hypothetical protein